MGCFRVAAPDDYHVAVLADVFDDILSRGHHTDETFTPYVFGAPVPTFPAVRVSYLLGKSAHLVEKEGRTAVRCMKHLTFAVAVALDQNAERSVFLVDSFDFIGDDIGSLIPGNANEFTLAANFVCSSHP